MCAYQESERIGEALASLLAAGCERLVVVDGAWRHFERYGDGPGSTDGTQQIARLSGAVVIEAPAMGWRDEVEARNAYLVGEPGDWYVILDADERMTGVLPGTLEDAPEGAHLVAICTAGQPAVRRIRVVREDGTLRYQYTHYGLYRQGRLVERAGLLDDVRIEHAGRPGDRERDRRKAAWFALANGAERAYLEMGWLPGLAMEDEMDRIAYRYVGAGAWIPGVPARDLRTSEAARYAEALASNLAGTRPLWMAEPTGEVEAEPAWQAEDEATHRGRRVRKAVAHKEESE